MSWVGVLEHHASRTPDKPLAIFGDETVTYGEMADARRPRSRPGCTSAGSARATSSGLLSYNCTEFLETIFAANYLGAIAMPINWRLAAPEVRYILDHSEARALVCDESLVDLANEATKEHGPRPRPGLHRDDRHPTGGRRSPTSGAESRVRACALRGRRRHPPADVHVGHHRAPEGRHAHPRQPGVEEPRAHHRVRLHRAPTSGSRADRCTTSARSTSRPPRSSPRARRRSSTACSRRPTSSTRSSGRA